MRTRLVVTAAIMTAALASAAIERDAQACGGCFGPPPPPTESPTVVTDHRMVLTISKEQSTLYDQIRYQGSPQSFAWVLPITGTVDVGLSSDTVFGALDRLTQTVIQAPPTNCPAPPTNCGGRNSAFGAAPGSAEDGDGVQVIKREVVGPYETVQLQATDPGALHNWLEQNGFVVPADVRPVIDTYVGEHFNFLALKLVPGKGIQEMRPVRVTTKGASAVLPLRMVAAGTGPVVGISLWVVGEGRYEPQNFSSFQIATDELVWDWAQSKSNYVDLRQDKTRAANGRAWEVESSLILDRQNVEGYVRGSSFQGANDPAPAYLPVKDAQGNVVKTAEQVFEEDMTALFYGIPAAGTRITRMRADLSHAALDVDLVMNASKDQAVLANFRQITREIGQPQCPIWNGCTQEGTAPRDEAIARSTATGDGETFSCATTRRSPGAWIAAGVGFVGLAVVHALRRRRR